MEKKNKIIIIRRYFESYSLYYKRKDSLEPRIVINTMGFYDVIEGLINSMPKDIYKESIKEIYFNEDESCEISKKKKEIFKEKKEIFRGLINILERFESGEKNLEYKIEEIKKILIQKEDKEEFLKMERLRNEKESFNSLYKIAKC